jgi:hypothetical protein
MLSLWNIWPYKLLILLKLVDFSSVLRYNSRFLSILWKTLWQPDGWDEYFYSSGNADGEQYILGFI